jgi:hypothetical protein
MDLILKCHLIPTASTPYALFNNKALIITTLYTLKAPHKKYGVIVQKSFMKANTKQSQHNRNKILKPLTIS